MDVEDIISTSTAPKKFVDWPFKYHEELVLEVDALSNLGVGVARHNITSEDGQQSQWV
jgi:hypothetical protein